MKIVLNQTVVTPNGEKTKVERDGVGYVAKKVTYSQIAYDYISNKRTKTDPEASALYALLSKVKSEGEIDFTQDEFEVVKAAFDAQPVDIKGAFLELTGAV